MEEVKTHVDITEAINLLEAEMLSEPQVDCPLDHIFTDGMYIRQVTLPAKTKMVGHTHTRQHPFVISKGVIEVFIDGQGWSMFIAPYTGVTEPGTKRVCRSFSETVWTTFHPTNIKPVDETYEGLMDAVFLVEKEIFAPINNPFTKDKGVTS